MKNFTINDLENAIDLYDNLGLVPYLDSKLEAEIATASQDWQEFIIEIELNYKYLTHLATQLYNKLQKEA